MILLECHGLLKNQWKLVQRKQNGVYCKLKATKPQVAQAVEALFDAEVAKVNIRITKHGKLASVRLAEGYDAEEAAMRLGHSEVMNHG